MNPGGGLPPEVPWQLGTGPYRTMDQVTEQVATCEAELRQAEELVRAQVDECMARAAGDLAEARLCIRGRIESILATADERYGKCRDKVARRVYEGLDQIYILTSDLLGPPPTTDEIVNRVLGTDGPEQAEGSRGSDAASGPGLLGPPIAGWQFQEGPLQGDDIRDNKPEPGQPAPAVECGVGPILPMPPGTPPGPPHQYDGLGYPNLKYTWNCCVPSGDPGGITPDGLYCRPWWCWQEDTELLICGSGEGTTPPPGEEPPPPGEEPPPPGATCKPREELCPAPPATLTLTESEPIGTMGRWNTLGCPAPFSTADNLSIDRILAWLDKLIGKSGMSVDGVMLAAPVLKPLLGLFGKEPAKLIGGIAEWIMKEVPAWALSMTPSVTGCESTSAVQARVARAALGLISKWIDPGLQQQLLTLDYEINKDCPVVIPSPAESHQLYVRGMISDEQWRCWVRANGIADIPAQLVRDANVARPTLEDLIQMRWRGFLATDQAYVKAAKYWGGWDSNIAQWQMQIREWIPPPTDLIRLMQRDVFDEKVVTEYKLYAEFDDKLSDATRAFARANGISLDTLRHYWAAHWDWPAPGQLYTMLHRLRPDGLTRPPNVAPVTQEIIYKTLGIKDVAPVWRDRLTAISYKVPGRIDLWKMYDLDTIDETELKSRLMDLGYDPLSAERMKEYFVWRKRGGRRKRYLGVNKWAGWYRDGLVSADEMESAVRPQLREWEREATISEIHQQREIHVRKQKIAMVKRAWRQCQMDDIQARDAMVNAGVPLDQAIILINQWSRTCDRSTPIKEKMASVSQLCEWARNGWIDRAAFLFELGRLGYSSRTAVLISRSCYSKPKKGSGDNGKPKGQGPGEGGDGGDNPPSPGE